MDRRPSRVLASFVSRSARPASAPSHQAKQVNVADKGMARAISRIMTRSRTTKLSFCASTALGGEDDEYDSTSFWNPFNHLDVNNSDKSSPRPSPKQYGTLQRSMEGIFSNTASVIWDCQEVTMFGKDTKASCCMQRGHGGVPSNGGHMNMHMLALARIMT
jgi:hypothetical protein